MDISAKTGFSNNSDILATAVAVTGADRPLITYYDDATGERTELSGATLGNWAAKTANMLVDGYGLGPGDRAVVMLPPHWQTAAVLIGAWTAGLAADWVDPRFVDLKSTRENLARPVDVSFTTVRLAGDLPGAADRFVLGLDPMALPLREVPDGFLDYVAEVRQYGDHFRPAAPIPAGAAASSDGTTFEEWSRLAHAMAGTYGIGRGDRVLVDATDLANPVYWLLAPFAAGASIVLCANLDRVKLDARVETERVTRVLPGTPPR
jgi:uncharacterized protein (TIGR03089 family)